MSTSQDPEILSAQVILKPDAVSSAPATIEAFQQAGFAIGRLVGNNFSITGPKSLFEQVFGTSLAVDRRGAVSRVALEGTSISQLPLQALQPQVRDKVLAVAFTTHEPFR